MLISSILLLSAVISFNSLSVIFVLLKTKNAIEDLTDCLKEQDAYNLIIPNEEIIEIKL